MTPSHLAAVRAACPEPNTMTTTDNIFSILAQSNARADAATQGPWSVSGAWIEVPKLSIIAPSVAKRFGGSERPTLIRCYGYGDPQESVAVIKVNTDFIAHARTDLPARDAALKVAVEALQEMADEASRNNAWYQCSHWLDAEEALTKVLAILKGGQA